MRLVIFDFDGTLAKERMSPVVRETSSLPEVIETFLTHAGDSHARVFVVTGRHYTARSEISDWINHVTGRPFPPERILTRWSAQMHVLAPEKLAAKLQNMHTLLSVAQQQNGEGSVEVIIYDNDPEMLKLYQKLLSTRGVKHELNIVDPAGKIQRFKNDTVSLP